MSILTMLYILLHNKVPSFLNRDGQLHFIKHRYQTRGHSLHLKTGQETHPLSFLNPFPHFKIPMHVYTLVWLKKNIFSKDQSSIL